MQIDAFCYKHLQVRELACASLRGWSRDGFACSSSIRRKASPYFVRTCREGPKTDFYQRSKCDPECSIIPLKGYSRRSPSLTLPFYTNRWQGHGQILVE